MASEILQKGPTVISPERFVEQLTAELGLVPGAELSETNMKKIAKKYPQLFPVALFKSLGRWNLVLNVPQGRMEIYDPLIGLRTIPGQFPAGSLLYFDAIKGNGLVTTTDIQRVRESGYYLSSRISQALKSLGEIQKNPTDTNSWMFSIYAGMVARGTIIPTAK